MINIKRILKKFIIAIVACLFVMPCAFGTVANVPMSEIGDYGNWMTNENVAAFDNALSGDITEFQSEFQTKHALPEMLTDIVLQTDSNRVAQRIYGYMEYTPQTESAVVFDKITLTRTRLDSERYNIHPYQRKTKWRQ